MRNLNKKVKEKIENFFDWIKGAELIELKTCDISEDPVRPELDVKFRTEYGRKIYGVKYKKEILGSKKCFAIESGVINGWEKYVLSENFIGMKTFGASGPYKDLYEFFGITSDNLVNLIKKNIN